jgi:hypothetical protein
MTKTDEEYSLFHDCLKIAEVYFSYVNEIWKTYRGSNSEIFAKHLEHLDNYEKVFFDNKKWLLENPIKNGNLEKTTTVNVNHANSNTPEEVLTIFCNWYMIFLDSILKTISEKTIANESNSIDRACTIKELEHSFRRIRGMKKINMYEQINVHGQVLRPFDDKKLDFELENIKELKDFIKSKPLKIQTQEKHTHIFSNNGYELFMYIYENHLPKNKPLNTIFFYFHQLRKDNKYIHVYYTVFKDWFNNQEFKETLDESKSENIVTTEKRNEQTFKDTLELFQLRKKNGL